MLHTYENVTHFLNWTVGSKPHVQYTKPLRLFLLTWIGLEIGTSTGGLSRWLRGRGWQFPQWGEISSTRSGRGRRELISGASTSATWRWATWTPAHAIGTVAMHGRKWLIHIWRWGTSCGRKKNSNSLVRSHLPYMYVKARGCRERVPMMYSIPNFPLRILHLFHRRIDKQLGKDLCSKYEVRMFCFQKNYSQN